MSDFDEVLERLLLDPAFKAALAANPQAALAGYRLEQDERALLGIQLVADHGVDRTVEIRTNKSGVVGLVGPVAAAFGVAATSTGATGIQSGGLTGAQALGEAPGSATFGAAGGQAAQAFGAAQDGGGGTQSFGRSDAVDATETLGVAQSAGGDAEIAENIGGAPVEATEYHTRVDVDGDGAWDAHTVYERADGGVDIVADADHDGRIDFVGHDLNRDGLVDVAEFDNDGDGTLDTRMHDDTGDGWMDRQERLPNT